MKLTLRWNGKPISNCNPPAGTQAEIDAFGLDPKSAKNLWLLWCALDAMTEGEEEAWMRSTLRKSPALSAILISLKRQTKTNHDGVWLALPGWVTANADKLQVTARLQSSRPPDETRRRRVNSALVAPVAIANRAPPATQKNGDDHDESEQANARLLARSPRQSLRR